MLQNANIQNAYSSCMDSTKTNIDEMRWHDKLKRSMKKINSIFFHTKRLETKLFLVVVVIFPLVVITTRGPIVNGYPHLRIKNSLGQGIHYYQLYFTIGKTGAKTEGLACSQNRQLNENTGAFGIESSLWPHFSLDAAEKKGHCSCSD